MTSLFEVLGIIGSLIVCGSVIPQVIRTFRTKSARDLSITSLSTLMLGLILLMAYSVHIRDWIFIFGNSLSLSSVGILIGFWRSYTFKPSLIKRSILVKGKEQNPCRL